MNVEGKTYSGRKPRLTRASVRKTISMKMALTSTRDSTTMSQRRLGCVLAQGRPAEVKWRAQKHTFAVQELVLELR